MSKRKSKSLGVLIALLVICFLFVAAAVGTQIYNYATRDKNPVGPVGPQGPAGEVGQRGTLWFKGEGDPNDEGVLSEEVAATVQEGDYFLDTATEAVYSFNGKKWTYVITLRGERGSHWDMGVGAPTGKDNVQPGDFYLDGTNGDVWQFVDGEWKPVFNIKGEKGDRGTTWLNGNGAPAPSLGIVGDYYIDSRTSDVYEKKPADERHDAAYWSPIGNIQGGQGVPGAQGDKGTQIYFGATAPQDAGIEARDGDLYLHQADAEGDLTLWRFDGSAWQKLGKLNGEQGAQGNPGLPGTPGSQWFYGEGDPTANSFKDQGAVGDFYLDLTTSDIYNRKASGWEFLFNIKGNDGANGNRWFSGNGAPTLPDVAAKLTDAKADDYYLDTQSGEIYQKGADGNWVSTGNIKGVTGDQGAAGATWHFGQGKPTSDVGKDGDFYLDSEFNLYLKVENAWVPKGSLKGAAGDTGAQGSQGVPGKDGTKWFSGNGAPTEVTGAKAGDYYLDLTTGDIYAYSESTGWGSPLGSIKGPQGGAATPGKDGTKWYSGEGAPTDEEIAKTLEAAVDGDFYLDTESGTLYKKTPGSWENIGSLKGPEGGQGPAGQVGPHGPNGSMIYYGTELPAEHSFGGTTLKLGDLYIHQNNTLDLYYYTGSAWLKIVSLRGPQGEQGEQGIPGKDGTQIYFGAEDPGEHQYSVELHNGDLYLNTNTYNLYSYNGSSWDPLGTLAGTRGSKWFTGNGAPDLANSKPAAASELQAGDYYLDTESGDVHYYNGEAWSRTGNIKGVTGDAGLNGKTWYYGVGDASVVAPDAVDGDFYLNTETFDVYVKDAEGWKLQGNIRGEAGRTWLNGTTAPDNSAGTVGDLYLNTTTGEVYLKSAENTWTRLFSIKGTDGTNGAKWYQGDGTPANELGAEGDFYLNTKTGDIYNKKSATDWGSPVGNLKGPRGSMIFSGTTDPKVSADLGAYTAQEGDLYLYTHDGKVDLYRYNGTQWTSLGTLTGEKGEQGQRGYMTFTGKTEPTGATIGDFTAQEGDLYIYQNEAEGKTVLYRFNNMDEWDLIGDLTGATGATGAAGKDGATTYFGTDEPAYHTFGDGVVPQLGDLYFYTNTDAGSITIYRHTGTSWERVGAVVNGKDGADGNNGLNGKTWYFGEEEPGSHHFDTDPVEGDFYLDTQTYIVYVKLADESWDPLGSIRGEVGTIWYSGNGDPNGKDLGTLGFTPKDHDYYLDKETNNVWSYNGTDKKWDYVTNISGTRGATWFVGMGTVDEAGVLTGDESVKDFRPGDFYLNSMSLNIYRYNGTVWEFVGLLKGPQGDKGERGTLWFSGNGNPNDVLHESGVREGDYYLDSSTGYIWKRGAALWDQTDYNIRGPKGDKGTVWYNGKGMPDTHSADTLKDARVGDYYLDTDTDNVYELVASCQEVDHANNTHPHWHNIGNIRGEKGDQGRNPWNAAMGKTVPSTSDGYEENDFYIATDTHTLYQLQKKGEDLVWEPLFDMKGEQGVRGTRWIVYEATASGSPIEMKPWTYFGTEEANDLIKGDIFLNSQTGNLWVYDGEDNNADDAKDETKWKSGGSIKGATGRAARWFTGAGKPADVVLEGFADGDMYLDTVNGDVYQCQGTSWEWVDNITGPRGSLWFSDANGDPTEENWQVTWPDLAEKLEDAKLYDIFFNTTTGFVYQLQYAKDSTTDFVWVEIGTVARGTRWFYGYANPKAEDLEPGLPDVEKEAAVGDFYFQGFYPFSGWTGYRVYVLELDAEGHKVWTLLINLSSKTGLTEKTYFIHNYSELVAFRNAVNDGQEFSDIKIVVANDIEIESGADWTPIGTDDHPFRGTFVGGAPKNETETRDFTPTTRTIKGVKNGKLFGRTEGATIQDIHIIGTFEDAAGDDTEWMPFVLSTLSDPASVFASVKFDTYTDTVVAEYTHGNALLRVTWNGTSFDVYLGAAANDPAKASLGRRAKAAEDITDSTLTFEDVYFILAEGVSYEFNGLKFTGNSYIDVTDAKSVTVDSCYADVDPIEACLRDAKGGVAEWITPPGSLSGQVAKEHSGYAAFIVSRNPEKDRTDVGLVLTVKNSTILAAQSTTNTDGTLNSGLQGPDPNSLAIYIQVKVASATIEGNVFGADRAADRYAWAAVKFTSIADNAELTFKSNEVYGTNDHGQSGRGATKYDFAAFALSDKDTTGAYTAKFESNTVNVDVREGGKAYNFLSVSGTGKAQVYFLDATNTFTAGETTTALYKAVKTASDESFDFIAFDAALNESNLLTAGHVYLGSNFGADHTQFTPDKLQTLAAEGTTNHDVWIIDTAFEDPLGFVQHVADYTANYYVNNAAGLGSFRDMVNGEGTATKANNFATKKIIQTDDINLDNEPWTPIAVGDSYNAPTLSFRGTYDGREHSISNIKIVGKHRGVGLFGAVTHGGAVENLTLNGNIQIAGYQDSGALVGYAVNATISHITIEAEAGSKITASYEAVGGVVGNAFGCTLTEITSNLDVESGVMYVGGIVGKISNGTTTIKTAEYTGTVNYSDADSWVGGIVGGLHSNNSEISAVEIDGATFSGTIQAKRTEYGIGFSGLVGLDAVDGTTAVQQEANYHVTIKSSTSTAQYEDSQYGWKGYQFNTKYGPEGNATKEALISTGDALALVSLQVQFGYYNYEGITLTLTQSVNMTNVHSWSYDGKGVKWYPIGTKSTAPFKGEFDGQSYEISGLTISPATKTDSTAAQASGLFGFTDGANIHDLTLNGVTITMNDLANVGALIGSATATTVKNVSVSGSVTGAYNVGGLIGEARGETVISYALVKGTITKTDTSDAAHARSIGALIGAADGTVTLSDVYTSDFYEAPVTVIDNRYTDGNLNYLVYNYGLVGSATSGAATDTWAAGKNVLPAAEIEFDATIAVPRTTGSVHAKIAATDLYLTANFSKGTVAHGNMESVYVGVTTARGLASVAELVNGGVSFKGETVQLNQNIDLEGAYQKENAITIGTEEHPFEGTFSGGYGFPGIPNYTIGHQYGSLFGYTDGATIQNLTLEEQVMQPLDGATAASGCAALVKEGSAKISNVTIKNGFVEKLNGTYSVDPGSVAAAPFGITGKAEGFTFKSVDITLHFLDITFTAGYDADRNALEVSYEGDSSVSARATREGITINNGAFKLGPNNYSFKNIVFTGDSYIDLADLGATSTVTIDGIYAEVTHDNYFIGCGDHQALAGALTLTKSTIIGTDAATHAIFSWRQFNTVTIEGNTFGSKENPFFDHVVKLMGNADGATYQINRNTVYIDGSKNATAYAFDFYQSSSAGNAYTAYLKDNVVYGNEGTGFLRVNCAAAQGHAEVYLLGEGNTFNGGHVDWSNITTTGDFGSFVGYDVEFEDSTKPFDAESNKIIKGHFIYSKTWQTDARTAVGDEYDSALKALVKDTDCYANVWVENGDGTRYNLNYNYLTLLIQTVEELEDFRDAVNRGETFAGRTVVLWREGEKLGSDGMPILSGEDGVYDLGNQDWEPIGANGHTFEGTFDGRGYTITNLYHGNLYTGLNLYIGLFGFVNGATLQNVKFAGNNTVWPNAPTTETKWRNDSGLLVGRAVNATISNIEITGELNVGGGFGQTTSALGGVAGSSNGSHFTNIKIAVEEKLGSHVGSTIGLVNGGVVGMSVGDTFEDIETNATVWANYAAGGVAGHASGSNFTNVTVKADIVLTDAASNNIYHVGIGGVVGTTDGSDPTFDDVHYTGHLIRLNNGSVSYLNYGLVGSEYNRQTSYSKNVIMNSSSLVYLADGFQLHATWEGGDVNAAYEVLSVEGLANFRTIVNEGLTAGQFAKVYSYRYPAYDFANDVPVKLTASLDLSEIKNWEAIGTDDHPFKGHFDGTDKIISNLTSEGKYAGLFGYVNSNAAIIENLTVKGANLTEIVDEKGEAYAGAVVAKFQMTTDLATGGLNKVHVEDVKILTAYRYAGGIVGQCYAPIISCSAKNVEIVAKPNETTKEDGSRGYDNGDKIGGITGWFVDDTSRDLKDNTAENITLTAYRDVGGIAGYAGKAIVDGNSVKNVTITVDQITNSYGDKETNAGYLYGRMAKDWREFTGEVQTGDYSLTYNIKGGVALQSALDEATEYGPTEINLAAGTYTGSSTVQINNLSLKGFTILGNVRTATKPAEGTYNETKTYTRSIKDLTIQPKEGEGDVQFLTPLVMFDTVQTHDRLDYLTCLNVDGITVRNIIFENVDHPIYFYSVNSNSHWTDLNFIENHISWDDPIEATNDAQNGIHVYSENSEANILQGTFFIQNVTVRGNVFVNTDYAIYAHNVMGLTVEGNDFNTYFHAAIGTQGSATGGDVLVTGNKVWNSVTPHKGSGFIRGTRYLGGTMTITGNKFYGQAANPDEVEGHNKMQLLINFAKTFKGNIATSDNVWFAAEDPNAATSASKYAIVEKNDSNVYVDLPDEVKPVDHAYHWHLELAISSLEKNGDLAGLAAFRDDVNNGSTYFTPALPVKLTADINLNNAPWDAIGTDAHPFRGHFDGDNKTITNLTSSGKYAGLFGLVRGNAIIENLTVKGATLTEVIDGNEAYAGAVVAKFWPGNGIAKLSKLHVEDVNIPTAYRMAGGLVGQSYGPIYDCSAKNVTITATPNAVGDNKFDNGDKIGGLVGWFEDNGRYDLKNNHAEDITITAYRDVGGLAGYAGQALVGGNSVKGVHITVDQVTLDAGDEKTNAGYLYGRIREEFVDWSEFVGTIDESDGAEYSLTYNIKGSVALQSALDEATEYGPTTINLAAGTYTGTTSVLGPSGTANVTGFNIDPNGRTSKDGVRTIRNLTIQPYQPKGGEGNDVIFTTPIMMFTGATSSIAVDGLKIVGITSKDVSRLIFFHNNNANRDYHWENLTFESINVSFTEQVTSTEDPNVGIYVYLEGSTTWANDNVTVSNSIFKNTTYALYMHNLNGLQVTGNTFDQYYWYAIGLQGEATGGDVVVKNNKFIGRNWSANGEGLLRGSNLIGNLTFSENDLYGYAANKDTTDNNKQLLLNLETSLQGTITTSGNKWHAQEALDGTSSTYAVVDRNETATKESGHYKWHLELAISSLADTESGLAGLKTFRDEVNEGTNPYLTSALPVNLTADINLSGEGWEPIGVSGHQFLGTFDGQGHTISNLSITNATHDGLGFFGSVHGTLRNFTIENVHIAAPTHSYMGGAVSDINGYVENVHVTGSIYLEGANFVGGVVGYSYANFDNISAIKTQDDASARTIDDGFRNEKFDIIASGESAGGLIGYIGEQGFHANNLTVENLHVYAAKAAGGAVGNVNRENTFDQVYVTGVRVAANDNSAGIILGTTMTGDKLTNYDWRNSAVWKWGEDKVDGIWDSATNASVVAPVDWSGNDVKPGDVAADTDRINSVWLNATLTVTKDVTGLAKIYKGTENTVPAIRYEVSSGEGLAVLAKAWNEGLITADLFEGDEIAIVLVGDIDMSGVEFSPIGNEAHPFTGEFDGAGNTIEKLSLNTPEFDNVGLFGVIGGGAAIHDLTLSGVEVVGGNHVGGLVGEIVGMSEHESILQAAIENVSLTGVIHVTGYKYVGGIVGTIGEILDGKNHSALVYIRDCHLIGKEESFVKGVAKEGVADDNKNGTIVGGIFGQTRDYNDSSTVVVSSCTVTNVDVTGVNVVGGIGGRLNRRSIENCSYSEGTVEATAEGALEAKVGTYAAGALIGTVVNRADKPVSITGCRVENAKVVSLFAYNVTPEANGFVGGMNADSGTSVNYLSVIDCSMDENTTFEHTLYNVTIGKYVSEDYISGVTVKTADGLKWVHDHWGDLVRNNETKPFTLSLVDTEYDLSKFDWTGLNGQSVTLEGNGAVISNLHAVGHDKANGQAGLFYKGGNTVIRDLTIRDATIEGSQAGVFAGNATYKIELVNCKLEGAIAVNYAKSGETFNGVGVAFGVVGQGFHGPFTLGLTIDANCTVTINAKDMTTVCEGGMSTDAVVGWIVDHADCTYDGFVNNGKIITDMIDDKAHTFTLKIDGVESTYQPA